MIYVVATIEVVPGKRDELLTEFRKMVPLVRAEAGCLEYGPTVDLPTNIAAQPPVRDNVVTVVEKWEDLPALERHLIAPHVIDYRARVKPLVVKTSLLILQPA